MSDHREDLDRVLAGEKLLSLREVAAHLDVPVTRIGDLLSMHKLAAVTRDGKRFVPARLLGEGASIPRFVSAAITVLIDGGYTDDGILTYLFTEDDSLPGRPIDALHGQGAREVIRRAQAMAF